MKKIVLLSILFALPLVFLSSCDNKDVEGTIVGKWELYTMEVVTTGVQLTIDPDDYITECQKKSWFAYEQDSNFTNYDDCSQLIVVGTWMLEGNTLTTTVNGVEQTQKVKSVSSVELVIDVTEGFSFGGFGFSMEGMRVLMKYKKIE